MTNLGILARFPLGVYQGHKADRNLMPSRPCPLAGRTSQRGRAGTSRNYRKGQRPPRKNLSRLSNGPRRTPDRATASRHVSRVPLTQQDEPIYVPRGSAPPRMGGRPNVAPYPTAGQYPTPLAGGTIRCPQTSRSLTQLCGEVLFLGKLASPPSTPETWNPPTPSTLSRVRSKQVACPSTCPYPVESTRSCARMQKRAPPRYPPRQATRLQRATRCAPPWYPPQAWDPSSTSLWMLKPQPALGIPVAPRSRR